MTEMPKAGDAAPEFEAKAQSGETIRLADFAGKKLAIYFYPKDNTSGCTKQACNLRDNWARLDGAGIEVIGVSADSVASHAKFADQFDLPFALVADPDRKLIEAYGVWGEKSLYGRKYMGIHRTTFLIDESGKIVNVIKKPRVGQHAQEILEGFGS